MTRLLPVLFVISLASASCATRQHSHYWHSGTTLSVTRIEEALRKNPLATGENIAVIDLGKADTFSHHLVQVRDAEPFHIHKNHDLTVFIHRGHRIMRIGDESFPAKRGDVLFVPRGVPHAFRNLDRVPAVAIAVFAPAFDGKDTISASEMK